MSKTQCDHHLALVSCDLTGVPNPDTPCKRCQYPRANWNWFCLSCKDVICNFNNHHSEHYQQTKHCLCVNCSSQAIWCCSCREYLDAQVTRSVDTERGKLSPQEQKSEKTVDAIFEASKLPLSIILVGVGDGPWYMMKE